MSNKKPTLTVQLMNANIRIAELEKLVDTAGHLRGQLNTELKWAQHDLAEAQRLVDVHKNEAHNLRLKQRPSDWNRKVVQPRTERVLPAWMENARAAAMASGKSVVAVRA